MHILQVVIYCALLVNSFTQYMNSDLKRQLLVIAIGGSGCGQESGALKQLLSSIMKLTGKARRLLVFTLFARVNYVTAGMPHAKLS